jgi:hypothetical protein
MAEGGAALEGVGEMKTSSRRLLITRIVIAGVLLIAAYFGLQVAAFLAFEHMSRQTPVQMFEMVFRRPAGAMISDLQGFGHGHSDSYSFQFRFRVSPADLQRLLAGGNLTESNWETAGEKFALRERAAAKSFNPPWEPERVPLKETYYRGDPNWKAAYIYVVVDRPAGIVYCVGSSGGT